MDKQNFDTTVNSLFGGMDHVLSSKTVVGEPQIGRASCRERV